MMGAVDGDRGWNATVVLGSAEGAAGGTAMDDNGVAGLYGDVDGSAKGDADGATSLFGDTEGTADGPSDGPAVDGDPDGVAGMYGDIVGAGVEVSSDGENDGAAEAPARIGAAVTAG